MVGQVKPSSGLEGPVIPAYRIGVAFAAGVLLIFGLEMATLSLELSREGRVETSLLRYALLFAIALPASLGFAAHLLAVLRSFVPGRGPAGRVAALAVDLVPAVPFAVLIPGLLDGPAISQSPWRVPLMCALLLVVAGGAILARVLIGRGAAAILRSRRSAPAGALALTVAVAVAVGLREVSRRVLPGLYDGFHMGLTFAAVGTASVGVLFFLMSRQSRSTSRRAPLIMALVALVTLPLGSLLSQGSPLARQILIERAPLISPLVGPAFDAHNFFANLGSSSDVEGVFGAGRSPYLGVTFDGEEKRSVVLITVDALRGDALDEGGRFSGSATGLRGISRDALRFERAYSPGNYTPVSIPAMVLGYFPAKGEEPSPREVISAPFNLAGYDTEFHFTAHEYASLEGTSLWPMASEGFFFRRYLPWYRCATHVLGEVEKRLDTSRGPVFVWAHLSDVHSPFLLSEDEAGAAGRFEKSYAGQLEYLDSAVAPFLRRLVEERPEVIWAFSSDHGESLGEHGLLYHGSSLYEEQSRVPLLLHGPGVEPGVVRDPVSIIDLGATLLELAGAEVGDAPVLPTAPGEASGRSQVLLVGKTRCGLIEGTRKLIVDPATGSIGLYNLDSDPAEASSLVEEERDIAKRMLGDLRRAGCPNSMEGIEL